MVGSSYIWNDFSPYVNRTIDYFLRGLPVRVRVYSDDIRGSAILRAYQAFLRFKPTQTSDDHNMECWLRINALWGCKDYLRSLDMVPRNTRKIINQIKEGHISKESLSLKHSENVDEALTYRMAHIDIDSDVEVSDNTNVTLNHIDYEYVISNISFLDEPYKSIIRYRYIDNLSWSEIEITMNMIPNQIFYLHKKALCFLKRLIKKGHYR